MKNISVIVPTFNGVEKLPFLLNALQAQTVRDFEVIIVVDGSTDRTVTMLNDKASHFTDFKIVEQANAGRSGARNRGVAESGGSLLIFYDDDMLPFPDSVERHAANHVDGEKLITGNNIELQDARQTDVQNYKAALTEKWTAKYGQSLTRLQTDNFFFTAANCSMKRTVFEKLKGFDERLTDAEDFNLGFRGLNAGFEVYFDRDNKAQHREFITAKSYVRRLREYRKAHLKMAELYKSQENVKHSAFKRMIYWLLAFPFCLQLIDADFLKILPRAVRYRLYDAIFHALSVEYPQVKL